MLSERERSAAQLGRSRLGECTTPLQGPDLNFKHRIQNLRIGQVGIVCFIAMVAIVLLVSARRPQESERRVADLLMSLAQHRADSLYGEGYLVKHVRCVFSPPQHPDSNPFIRLRDTIGCGNRGVEAQRLALLYHEHATEKQNAAALVIFVDGAIAIVAAIALSVLW